MALSRLQVKKDLQHLIATVCDTVKQQSDAESTVKCLQQMTNFLPSASHNSTPFEGDTFTSAKDIFLQDHYTQFLEFLLSHLSIDLIQQIPKSRVFELIDAFVMDGVSHDAILMLCAVINKSSQGYQLNKCILLLEEFLKQHKLQEVLWSQCTGAKSATSIASTQYSGIIWPELINTISSIPEKMTNKLGKETSGLFYPTSYIPLVAEDLLTVLYKLHSRLKDGQDCSVAFLSQLIGKLCIAGHTDLLWSKLLPKFIQLTSSDFLWCRVCERLVHSVPDRCIEATVLPILKTASWYGVVCRLLGDCVLTSQKLKLLLTHKLLLMRHFEKVLILQNSLGYLAYSQARRHLFIQSLNNLLAVWGDASAIKHTSYEQHLYISKAVIICLGFLSEKEKMEHKEEYLRLLMPAVQHHINSPVANIRTLGMVVAELLTQTVDPGGQKLKFEYPEDDTTTHLKTLIVPPEDPAIDSTEGDISDISTLQISPSDPPQKTDPLTSDNKSNTQAAEEELDSDDDLEPYDMSNDTKFTKTKAPVYIRDCMEGLICSDDPDRVEVCLQSAEKLIRNCFGGLKEIAAEFAKILLHLDDNSGVLGFTVHRHCAMVALAVNCPRETSEYLAHQFFERNYNIRQRMDILEVLAAAAKELSQPTPPMQNAGSSVKIQEIDSENSTENWKDIVQKRIESKTRRFAKGRTKPELVPVENKFAPVAGYFFFPLLQNFDRKDLCFDLLGEDCMLLSRLLYTLGVIMYAATNAPIVRQMAKALIEFIWVVRYHPEQAVRRAVLFALSMLFLAVPGYILCEDLQQEMQETKVWLEDIVKSDPDTECRTLAVQAMVILENSLHKEFQTR